MNRRTGKIARFPKDLRELVNQMLDDGAQYESIIRALDRHRQRWPDGINELTVNNLSNWHSGGYQDWVRHQEVAADLKARHDSLAELLENSDSQKLHETVLHVSIAQLYHAIAGFNRDTVESLSTNDPAAYARIVTVFQRFSHHSLLLQKLKLQAAQQNVIPNSAGFIPKALPAPIASEFPSNPSTIISNSQ